MKNACHSELVSESKNMTNLPPHPSGFPYGRSEASPAGEQMERTGATLRQRHSASMEEIQDSPLPQGARERSRVAFTLAEILITLGIIGVVAAMTIPTLMTKIHRQKVETHLKKFHSTINQAIRLSIEEHDDIPNVITSDLVDSKNADKLLAWTNEYIVKNLSGASSAKITDADVKVILKDGSGFVLYLQHDSSWAQGVGNLYIFYCINPNKNCAHNAYDGQNSFLFQYNDENKFVNTGFSAKTNEVCKSSCYNQSKSERQCCAELIKRNSWKIPDDYPWIK